MDAEEILSSRAANLLLISTEYCCSGCCNSAGVQRAEKFEIELFECFLGVFKLILMLPVSIQ